MDKSAIDEAFHHVREEPGMLIWRIEQFKPVPLAEEEYGRFNEGDSYIVYNARELQRGAIESHIHFWLGKDSTMDETATAARKTVELDQHLGDRPIQHREVQGHESDQFMSYFRSSGGVEYVPGGVESGFRRVVEENPEPRLLQVKGKRNVRVTPVPVAASSMNHGDCFILDLGDQIFLWSGGEANRHEKGKAMEVMTRLYNSRGAKADRIVVDDEPDNEEFWNALGGSVEDVQAASDEASDEASASGPQTLRLFRVSNESGTMETTEVEKRGGKLYRDMLDGSDVFILDAGTSFYVWAGREANSEEKAHALETANKFIEEGDGPHWASATVIRQHMEPVEFKSMFHQWNPPSAFNFSHKPSGDIARDLPQEAIDFAAVHKGNPESERMIDDGSGTVRVWRIVDNEMTEVDESEVGEFFSGDSYLVHYHYTDPKSGEEGDLVYFWLGRNSETIEKGTAAARAVELSDSLGGVGQIRLTQGKEPPHFCAIFKNNMVVHNGGMRGQREPVEGEPRLYQVKGFQPNTTRAVEIDVSAENLNSGDCFVLVEASRVALWEGKHSSEEEREVATNIADRLSKENEVVVMVEGEEDDQFWESLGGKADYPEGGAVEIGPEQPRLFNVSNRTGTLRMEEVTNFAQDDLLDDDVMILDTVNQIFVWIGREASKQERENATRIAEEYLQHAAEEEGRDVDIPVIVEHSGHENNLFTCNFPGWDTTKAAEFVDPYEARRKELRQETRERAAWQVEAEEKAAARRKAVQEQEQGGAEGDAAAAAGGGGGGGAAAVDEEAAAVDEEAARRVREAGDDSETRRRLEEAERERQARIAELSQKKGASISPGDATFSLEELRAANPDDGPDIDFAQKEAYLSDAEFQEVFGMDRDSFNGMPPWKQKREKQQHGLF